MCKKNNGGGNISSDKNFVDLFAGAGGLSLGLHLSGLNGIFAVERDKMAFSTLKHNLIDRVEAFNWPDWLPKIPLDIRYLLDRYSDELKQLRKDVDIVVGGPPCQGFSLAGRRVEHDERNQMFKEYAKFVDLVKPEALLFENVPGFSMPFRQNKASEKSFSSILAEQLKQIGYEAPAIGTIDFSKFGIPQKRRRLIISTTIKGGDPIKIFEKLKNRERMDTVTTEDAISDLMRCHGEVDSPDSPGFLSARYGKIESQYQKAMRLKLESELPDSHRFARHSDAVANRFVMILGYAARNRTIDDTLKRTLGIKKRNIIPLDPHLPAPTLTTLPDDYVHYSEPRILTVREYARIQSFPDWFEFKGKYTTGGAMRARETPRYTQVANAVPPIFSLEVGTLLLR